MAQPLASASTMATARVLGGIGCVFLVVVGLAGGALLVLRDAARASSQEDDPPAETPTGQAPEPPAPPTASTEAATRPPLADLHLLDLARVDLLEVFPIARAAAVAAQPGATLEGINAIGLTGGTLDLSMRRASTGARSTRSSSRVSTRRSRQGSTR